VESDEVEAWDDNGMRSVTACKTPRRCRGRLLIVRWFCWGCPKYAFEEKVSVIYDMMIKQIARENATILAALK